MRVMGMQHDGVLVAGGAMSVQEVEAGASEAATYVGLMWRWWARSASWPMHCWWTDLLTVKCCCTLRGGGGERCTFWSPECHRSATRVFHS